MLRSTTSRAAVFALVVLALLYLPAASAADTPDQQLAAASAHFDAGRFAEAAQLLDSFLAGNAAHPRAAVAALALGRARMALGDHRAALAAFEKAAATGDSGTALGAKLGIGEAATAAGEHGRAASALEVALRSPLRPEQASTARILLAQAYLHTNRAADAETAYLVVVREHPESDLVDSALLGAASAALGDRRPEAAQKHLHRLLTEHPASEERPRALLLLAQIDREAGRHAEARARYEEALAAPGIDAAERLAAEQGLAQVRAREASSADPDTLIAHMERAAPSERPALALRAARFYLEQKRYASAASVLEALIRERPAAALLGEAHYLLAIAVQSTNYPERALQAFVEAARVAPDAPWAADARVRAAWLQLEAKQPAEAERMALAAIAAGSALRPELASSARLVLVQARMEQQKWDAAAESAHALLALKPSAEMAATAMYAHAWANERRDRKAEALALWERLAQEHPKSLYAATALLRLGDGFQETWRYNEAREQYVALLSRFPTSPLATEARFKLGVALYSMDRFAEAGAEWEKVLADPGAGDLLPEALYWAGVAHEKAGRPEQSIRRLGRLVQEFPTHAKVENAKIRLAALEGATPAP